MPLCHHTHAPSPQEYNCNEELIALYRSRGEHRQALDQLKSLQTLSPTERTDRLGDYLMQLGEKHVDVILDILPEVLKVDLEAGLEVVTSIDYLEVKALPRARVLARIQALAPSLPKGLKVASGPYSGAEGPITPATLVIRYLERVRTRFGDVSADIHTAQALAYFDVLVPMMKVGAGARDQSLVMCVEFGSLGL